MLLAGHNPDRNALPVRQRAQIPRNHVGLRNTILEREADDFLVHPRVHYLGHRTDRFNRLAALLFLLRIRWNQQLLEFQQHRSLGNPEHPRTHLGSRIPSRCMYV